MSDFNQFQSKTRFSMSGELPSKMGGEKPPYKDYRQSKGKKLSIQCRVCDKEMLYQNYQAHLKFKHTKEDFRNLSTKSDKSIKNVFQLVKPNLKRPAPDTDNNNKRNCPEILDSNQNTTDSQNSAPDQEPGSSSLPLVENDVDDGDHLLHNPPLLTAPGHSAHQAEEEQKARDLEDQKDSVETLNRLVTKLAPLANIEDSVISKLVENIENLAMLTVSSDHEKTDKKDEKSKSCDFDLDTLFFSCHSVKDITNKFQEYEYDDESGGFVCCVCNTQTVDQNVVIKYNCDAEKDFAGKNQTREFTNLKKSLKRHLHTMAHKTALDIVSNKADIQFKEDSRNKAVALRICRIAYFLLKTGRPDTDFTTLIYLHSANGCDAGDINHSYRFPPEFLKHVCHVIEGHLKTYLSSRLIQTGYKPPVKVVADKATWQHQTRQLIGIVTVVPDSEQPLQAMVLKTPVVKTHSGQGVADNIIGVTDQFISADQYRGGSFDGQYFHLSVPTHLDAHYGVTAKYDVDPMHRAGTVDLHLRKEKSSGWIVSMTTYIGKSFKVVNFGKQFEHFFEVCEELSKLDYDIKFKFPRFYSETKFANYVRLVYTSFREDYAALVRTFREVIERLKQGSSEDRQKAKDISTILGKILNLKFVLEVSGSCDVYNRFGHGINILQTVSIMPHTKYDNFVATAVDGLATMAETVDPEDCPCGKDASSLKCFWPVLHKDLREIADKSTYRGVTMGNLMADELSTRAGARKTKENLMLDQKGVTKKCLEELKLYSKSLGSSLLAKVYQEEDKKLIETVRVVSDLETLALRLKLSGSAHVAAVQTKLFIQKSRELAPKLSDISDEELRYQYRDFLRKLERLIEDQDEDSIFTMDIFKNFLDSELKLYIDNELIVHILCLAATSISVESIVESWVSIYESHSNKHRPISNDRAEMEISVAVNGPLLQHADSLLKEALKNMYKDTKDVRNRGGRFVRRNENIADYTVSKSVDAFMLKPNLKPFMC